MSLRLVGHIEAVADPVPLAGDVGGRVAPYAPRDGRFVSRSVLPRGQDVQAHVAMLRERLALLPPRDRVLIELVPTGQRSLREVARMIDADPGTLSRRLRVLWGRLHHPLVSHLFDRQASAGLPSEHRQVGIERHLLGMHLCDIADKHRMSPRDVRTLLDQLSGYARGKGLRR